MFWEQYPVSIDSKPRLTDPEKLAYLCQALKDGEAKEVIEGLSGLGDDYKDTVEYLCERYDKRRLIHREHVHSIVEAPSLKERSTCRRELRRLHDVLSWHLCALTTLHPYGPFVTVLVELKLDQATNFEW